MSRQARKLVAVVDDDPRILESLEDLLESSGYEVRLHSSASSLLASDVSNIDCLITDIGMPIMDGFELRNRVRQLLPSLPVFLFSGRRELIDAPRTTGQSELGLLRKPFDIPALLAAIDEAVRGTGG